MNHTHADHRLTFGCPACAETVAADQAAAELAAAPVRRCTWHCQYLATADGDSSAIATLTFTLDVKVPAGWTGAQVDEQYCAAAGERFLVTLPDDLTSDAVNAAVETMEITRVAIGEILPDAAESNPTGDVRLFELGGVA